VGESFAQAAEMATQFQYWNAAGVLLVHAATQNFRAVGRAADSLLSYGSAPPAPFDVHHSGTLWVFDIRYCGELR
jgi:hypothetical protein